MKGLVRIRLSRFGRKFSPVYNIVVAKSKTARDRQPIEVLGTYDPIPSRLTPQELERGEIPVKDVKLDFDKAKYWIGVGAQPTPVVSRLFKKAGILDPDWPKPSAVKKPLEERKVVIPARKVVL